MLRGVKRLLFLLALLIPCTSTAAPAADPPEEDGGRVHEFVPRNVQVSIALDHVWGSVRSEVAPADVGEQSWASWDQDGDGQLAGDESAALASSLRDRELEHLCVAVDGQVLSLIREPAVREEPTDDVVALDARVVVRVEGRMDLDLAAGWHRFVLYDRPRGLDGVVPFRLSLGRGLTLHSTGGARNEALSPRRVEAVVSMFAPSVWGIVSRTEAAMTPVAPAPLPAP